MNPLETYIRAFYDIRFAGAATWHLHIIMVKPLFEQLSRPSKLEPLAPKNHK